MIDWFWLVIDWKGFDFGGNEQTLFLKWYLFAAKLLKHPMRFVEIVTDIGGLQLMFIWLLKLLEIDENVSKSGISKWIFLYKLTEYDQQKNRRQFMWREHRKHRYWSISARLSTHRYISELFYHLLEMNYKLNIQHFQFRTFCTITTQYAGQV